MGSSVEEIEPMITSDVSSIQDIRTKDHIRVKKKKAVDEMY